MKNVTAIVISFLRPGYTKACVESLRRMYPEIKIVVGDNGGENAAMRAFCERYVAEYFPLPYDSGVCVGRNELMKRVNTEYVLVGDDDFFYTDTARVRDMASFLDEHKEFDLIGGRVEEHGVIRNYQGYTEHRTNHIQVTAIDLEHVEYQTHGTLRYCPADLTFNFFIARTESIRPVPWDEEIKVAYEHLSWFLDFKKAGGKVAFTPDAIVVHKPDHIKPEVAEEYAAFRNRRGDKERFFKKFKIEYTIGMNGHKDLRPGGIFERRTNDTKFVDFCITTFKRPKALERLLFSIARYYPMANVYVADQNQELDRVFYKKLRNDLFDAGLQKRVSVEHLPYDCGLSYARNHLVRTTPNKLKLILDDDMVFTPDTDIGKMVRLMEAFPRAGVVGGKVSQLGHDIHFEFDLVKKDGMIVQMPDKQPIREIDGIHYKKTGCVLNFALMRKDLFHYIQWDQTLKVTEHMDFYLRMPAYSFQILYTPDVVIDHPPVERAEDYKELRQRKEFMVFMLRKHGVRGVKYLNGQVTELAEDGRSLKRYKEKPTV